MYYRKDPFPKIFPEAKNYQSAIEENQDQYKMSDRIEKVMLDILGKNIIGWENMMFILNKAIFILVLIILTLYRTDLPTVYYE